MSIKPYLWTICLLGCCSSAFLAQSPPSFPSPSATEQRIEQWRELLKQGQAAAVADSCAQLLAHWPPRVPEQVRALAGSLRANALRQSGRPEEALALHQQVLKIRERLYGTQHHEVAGSCQNIGNCLLDLDRAREALPFLQKAATIKERSFKNYPHRLLSTYISLGQCYAQLEDFPAAKQSLDQALEIETRLNGPKSEGLTVILLSLADLQSAQEQHDVAFTLLQRARALPLDTLGAHREIYIRILDALGKTYAANGRPTEAIATLQNALLLCKPDWGQSNPLRGQCLLDLGNCQIDLGDNPAAELSLQSARACFPDAPANQAGIVNSLALVLRYRGRSREAADSFLVAYNLYLRARASIPSLSNLRASAGVCMNLGSAYLDQRAFPGALFYFQKALDLYLDLPQSAPDLAACYDKIGQVHLAQGNLEATSEAWDLAFSLAPKGPPGLRFAVWLHRGDWQGRQQLWEAALASYQSALAIVSPPGPRAAVLYPYESVQVRASISRLWLTRSRQSGLKADWEKTLTAARDAMGALDALKSSLRTDRSAIELQEIFHTPFDVAVEAALSLGQAESAWRFSEAFKINFLQQLSWRSNEQSDFGLPPGLIAAERSRSRRLAYFQQRRSVLGESATPQRLAVDDSIRQLSEAGYQFRLTLARQYPAQFKLLYTPELPDIAAVRRRLRPSQSLLAYHWGQERAWAFVIRPDTFAVRSLTLNNEAEEQTVLRFFDHCSGNPYAVPDDQRQRVFAELCTDGQALYRSWMAPVADLLKESVIVVPDGLLCLLPFEALLTSADTASYRFHRHHFLIKKYHIGYAHSAAAWLSLCQRPRSEAPRPLLAIAPDFDHNTHGLRPLRHNAAEADSVQALTGGDVWHGNAARKQRFQAEADQYRVLLLSTHGVTDDREPLASFVAFTSEPSTAHTDDDLLRVSDLYALRLPADLVVLSACQTASGRLYRGEGMLSVARAFQYAGAKSLVASLWNVDDRQTPALMRSFFGFLWQKREKSAALAESKKAYLKSHQGLDAHPYYWAGLVSIGDDSQLAELPADGNWPEWLAIGLGVCVAALLLFRYWKK